MFGRFDTWIIIGIFSWLVLGGLIAWLSDMKKRLEAAEKKNVELRLELNRKAAELYMVEASSKAHTSHAVMRRDEYIEMLTEKLKASECECKRLEILLNQKWKTANGGES